MSALVSVIIPVYNAAEFLDECLTSVRKQTYKNLEVIMINDGSIDSSDEYLEKFVILDNRFTKVVQENQGLGYTRNRGLSLSNGEFVFFLDADDTIPAKAIESLVAVATANNAEIAVGKVVRLTAERKYLPPRHVEFGLYNRRHVTSVSKYPALLQDSIACNKLWKRSFLIKNNLVFKEKQLYEDMNFTMKATVLAQKIAVINTVVYEWRIRDSETNLSITQLQMTLTNALDRIKALDENNKWLLESNCDREVAEEHELKGLLDLIRLHAVKFHLIKECEKAGWIKAVYPFIAAATPEIGE